MFSKGDMVVYPMYGAGVIEGLEEKVIDGQDNTYYVLRIPIGNLKIMVSVANAESIGIRKIMKSDELVEVIGSVKIRPIKMHDNWNQRYKENMEKIRTGSLCETAEVFRNLRQREKERGLSSAEKKMLTNVKQIILSEIILSHSIERSEAEDILDRIIDE